MKLAEKIHGTGGIRRKIDLRDHKFHKLVGRSGVPFDWQNAPQLTTILKNQTLVIKDQGASSSCGGQAGSYYAEKIKGKQKSARFIYAPICVEGGGTDMRSVLKRIVQVGVVNETTISSYENGKPPSESYMEYKGDFTSSVITEANQNKLFGFAFCKTDIETIAQACRDCGGAMVLIKEENNDTWRSFAPLPPSFFTDPWQHFVFGAIPGWFGEKKAIAFPNSWGEDVGQRGWQVLTEDHFAKGCVLEAGVIYDKNIYQYSPNVVQKYPLNWLQLFMNWFSNFWATKNY